MSAIGEELTAEAIAKGLGTHTFGRHVHVYAKTSSTMDRAIEAARAGAPEGALFVAEEQTAGRGRFGRAWVSPPGSQITISLVLRPQSAWLHQLNMAAPLAVVRAVERATGLQPAIKWPNDVQLAGKKLAGLLLDVTVRDGETEFAIAGIGLNVNFDPGKYPEIAAIATSISKQLGRTTPRLPILWALLEEFEALYQRVQRGEKVTGDYKAKLATLGTQVRVTWATGTADEAKLEEGTAVDIDDAGALILRRNDGFLAHIVAGEVSLR
jgi:BirA family biotin operon repressor/biotin-[acetyl-CoA-carboxylase] ligase